MILLNLSAAIAMFLTIILCLTLLATGKAEDEEIFPDEVILEDLLSTYDRRILPTKDGLPVDVAVRANIVDMAEKKSIHSHYGTEVVLHSYWNDFRLAFNSTEIEDIRLAGKRIELVWTPDFTFEEKIGIASKVTTDNKFIAIYPNGDILFSQRVILTMFCPMEFSRFPFDDQECQIPILSSSYNSEQMNLSWMSTSGGVTRPGVVFRKEPSEMEGVFRINDYSYGEDERTYGESEKYDELIITLHFRRRFSYYLVRIYMPLILIVCMSFGAFWIDYRSTPARTIMSTTIVLTVVTFIVSIQGSLPPTKSIRSIDIYTLCCFMFVFAALIEFAFVQTIDVQVKIIIRNHEKQRTICIDENGVGNSKKASKKAASNSVVSPGTVDGNLTPPVIKIRGVFGKFLTKIYKAHLKHREEFHILDRFAKRAFPLTFIVLNMIYFIASTAHFA